MKILRNLKLRISSISFLVRLQALQLLADLGIVIEHKSDNVHRKGPYKPHPTGDIKSSRYVFKSSRVEYEERYVHQHWFETLKGKRLLTLADEEHIFTMYDYRLSLESFLAHFSPTRQMWLHRCGLERIKVHLLKPEYPVSISSGPIVRPETIPTETVEADFSKCRFAFQRVYKDDEPIPPEEYQLSEIALSLDKSIPEINKILTGVEDDGELTLTRDGVKMLLAEDFICVHCGLPVFIATTGSYQFSCARCGDTRYGVRRVNHPFYSVRKKETYDTLIELCNAAGDTL